MRKGHKVLIIYETSHNYAHLNKFNKIINIIQIKQDAKTFLLQTSAVFPYHDQ